MQIESQKPRQATVLEHPFCKMKKNTRLKNEDIAEQLQRDRWPHTTEARKWKPSSDSFKRVCRMVKKLCAFGMPLEETVAMFNELYWCAYGDIQDMPKPELREEKHKRAVPYFDEFQIMFRVDVAEVTAEELKRDYEFYCNAYASGENIWWTNSGGGGAGGPLHNFLGILRLDNNYAFGPTKKQSGWPAERLAEKDAVGVYKRKELPVRLGKHPNATTRLSKAKQKKR